MSLQTPDVVRRLQRTLYVKAKNEPAYRFYLLYDKVYREDILWHAFRVSRAARGAAGVDGVTFQDTEAAGVDEWVAGLRRMLHEKTYQPDAVRQVLIPKPDGGTRPLGIPTIRAGWCKQPSSWQWSRSSKRTATTVRMGIAHIGARKMRSGRCTSPCVRSTRRWSTPIEVRDAQGGRRMTGGKRSTRGTPQGGVISPLLANLYRHRCLRAWRARGKGTQYQARIINYADDFIILSRGHATEARVRRDMDGVVYVAVWQLLRPLIRAAVTTSHRSGHRTRVDECRRGSGGVDASDSQHAATQRLRVHRVVWTHARLLRADVRRAVAAHGHVGRFQELQIGESPDLERGSAEDVGQVHRGVGRYDAIHVRKNGQAVRHKQRVRKRGVGTTRRADDLALIVDLHESAGRAHRAPPHGLMIVLTRREHMAHSAAACRSADAQRPPSR